MTKETFMKFYPGSVSASTCYDSISSALREVGIYSDMTLLGALATVRIEVGREYKPIPEIASGEAYENRADLGNFTQGDGVRYKGRGFIQLTGRYNYDHYGRLLGIDLIGNPELALDVNNSARILAYYFKDRKVNLACDNRDWQSVRRLVNGGLNHYDDFIKIVNDFLEVHNEPVSLSEPQNLTLEPVEDSTDVVKPQNKLDFLYSPSFWSMFIGSIAMMMGEDGTFTMPEIYKGLMALSGGFTGIYIVNKNLKMFADAIKNRVLK